MERLHHVEEPLFDIDPKMRVDELAVIEKNPIFQPENLDRLQALQDANIPYVIYSGAHVAWLTRTNRPVGDIDVMIREDDYPRLRTLEEFRRGQTYKYRPLLWPSGEPRRPASFLAVGDLEIKAGSDHTPGYFTFTELVQTSSTPGRQRDAEDAQNPEQQGHEIMFAAPTETFLFKLAMWRRKDYADIYNMLAQGIRIDATYLEARICETRTEDQITNRFDALMAMQEDIMRRSSNPEAIDGIDHNIGVIARFTHYTA